MVATEVRYSYVCTTRTFTKQKRRKMVAAEKLVAVFNVEEELEHFTYI